MTDSLAIGARRELAHRISGSIEITLYWSPEGNGISVEVRERDSTQLLLAFPVARESALDAFYHPFVHLLGMPCDVAVTAPGP